MKELKFIKIKNEDCKKCLKHETDYLIIEPNLLGPKYHFVCSDCAQKIKKNEENKKSSSFDF